MTPLTPQRVCTAMVWTSAGMMGGVELPCGEPVAELGPCVARPHFDDGLCKSLPDNHDWEHTYQGRLVHVSPTGLCGTCGHPEAGHSTNTVAMCHGCDPRHKSAWHEYVPEYVEREGLGHEAEVSDETA